MKAINSACLILVLALAERAHSGSLISMSSSSSEMTSSGCGGLLGLLGGLLSREPLPFEEMKFDKRAERWTRNCSDVDDCQNGVADGDEETCPSCLRGAGQACGKWSGDCATELVCQFPTHMDRVGKCVSAQHFNSSEVGERCGARVGNCSRGLRCQYRADPMSIFAMVSPTGSCVTEADFKTRGDGQTCGELVGDCAEGLVCSHGFMPFYQAYCKPAGDDEKKNESSLEIFLLGFDEAFKLDEKNDDVDEIDDKGDQSESSAVNIVIDIDAQPTDGDLSVDETSHDGLHEESDDIVTEAGSKDKDDEITVKSDGDKIKVVKDFGDLHFGDLFDEI